MRAVASRDVGSLARLYGSVRPLQAREHTAACIVEVDQQTLVFVLRKNQRVRERAESCADVAEEKAGDPLASHPEIPAQDFSSTLDDGLSDADLTVELERACLYGER